MVWTIFVWPQAAISAAATTKTQAIALRVVCLDITFASAGSLGCSNGIPRLVAGPWD